ncbi:hypothetical protein FHX33_000344 [Leifsonia aquatica]|uniref:Uncharacterized protein n=2 Tax=Leifsonia TaxID=110932 RepID=A0A7W4UT57_LEIAQ|nr:hypothetical protein [Leifsonia aquatica]NYK08550.1 hypothetical protein [Leifsonia naganoensis]
MTDKPHPDDLPRPSEVDPDSGTDADDKPVENPGG